METLACERDDLVYGSDGFPLDVLPPTWVTPVEPDEKLDAVTEVFEVKERLLNATEAASYVGVHANTIYAAAQSGALKCRKVGRLRRFTVSGLDAWTGGEAT